MELYLTRLCRYLSGRPCRHRSFAKFMFSFRVLVMLKLDNYKKTKMRQSIFNKHKLHSARSMITSRSIEELFSIVVGSVVNVKNALRSLVLLFVLAVFWAPGSVEAQSAQNPQSGSIGIQGTISADPPSEGAIISFPVSGQEIVSVPVEISGICNPELLVKVFKNDVFAGSSQCGSNGAFSVLVDLFNGSNEIVARVFDDLDQPGPDSNKVVVRYSAEGGVSSGSDSLLLNSNFAKRGANPGTSLAWPMAVTGGVGPYAIVVEWGDGSEDILSMQLPGEFNPSHVYDKPGTYKVVVKATDSLGETTYLQLVGVANGALVADFSIDRPTVQAANLQAEERSIPLWSLYLMVVLIFSTFWLGKRYERRRIKKLNQNRLA